MQVLNILCDSLSRHDTRALYKIMQRDIFSSSIFINPWVEGFDTWPMD